MEDTNPAVVGPVSGPGGTEADLHELQILAGGVTITVILDDASQEQVKVRQLPFSELPEWAELRNDEAGVAELLCGKQNKTLAWRLRNSRAAEERLLALLPAALLPQVPVIEKELARVRGEIEKMEAEPRWADRLAEDSLVEIIALGERLNEKRFGRWLKRRMETTGRIVKATTDSLSDKSPPPAA